MVRLARRRGAERASVTTNGTAPPGRTLALLDAGLDGLRVSLDAHEPGLGLALAGRPGAWRAAVATLRAVGRARRAGAAMHLVVNAVATPANRRHLARLVRLALDEGADDVKLITEVEGREGLPAFPELPAVRAELEALLAGRPPSALPLLRRKVRTVFAPEAIGLGGVAPPAGRPWRCHIPLTERTVDGGAYYPCPVYRREGGRPLSLLADPPAAQRLASARFVREADCLADPICRRYCLHCTRAFNAAANAAAEAA